MYISSVTLSRSCVACADPESFVRGVHSDSFFSFFFFLVNEGRMDPNTTKWPTIECRLVVVDSLLVVAPIMGFCGCSMFCCASNFVHSIFAIILTGKRDLDALL